MSATALENVVTPLAARPARAKARRTRRRRLPLYLQVVEACEAMVRYALASGTSVPAASRPRPHGRAAAAALIPMGDAGELSKPLLALLGGFSASVLYRILERLVQTVESLVRGETHEQQADQLADAVARQVTRNPMSTNRLEQHS
jgi:hypothetical protein